jgi:glycyl-tRNA synthetase beta chain
LRSASASRAGPEVGPRRGARQGRPHDRHGRRVSGIAGHHGPLLRRGAGLSRGIGARLEEHYRPRFAGDALPTHQDGPALALADKIDTLVGIFAIEQRPTGAKDPFGLRRAALGVLRILLECRLGFGSRRGCSRCPAAAQPVQRPGVAQEVYDFIAERLRGLLLERADGTSAEMIDAVLATAAAFALDADERLQALKEFLRCPMPPC